MISYTGSELRSTWKQALIKLLMQPAQRILTGEPAKRRVNDGTTVLTKIIPLAIIALSLASVTNMAARAYSHHASNSSYAIGLGLAVMVPMIVFAALRLKNGWARMFAWICALTFAFFSGSIQFQIYNEGKPITIDSLFSFSVNLEALAFGFGVPLAECVLAALEGLLVWQIETKADTDAAQVQAAEQERIQQDEARARAERAEAERREIERQEREARAERERMEWQAKQERERMEWQAEQDRLAAEHAQKLELQREKEQVRLHKTAQSTAQRSAQKGTSTTGRTTPDMQHIVHLSKPEQAKHLHNEGFTNSEIARLLRAHRNSVGNWLKNTNGATTPTLQN